MHECGCSTVVVVVVYGCGGSGNTSFSWCCLGIFCYLNLDILVKTEDNIITVVSILER